MVTLALGALLCVAAVSGQPDVGSTNLCFPTKSTFTIYATESQEFSRWSLDYNRKKMAGRGHHWAMIKDYGTGTDWLFHNSTSGPVCERTVMDALEQSLYYKCLPHTAMRVATVTVGYGAGALAVETWSVPTEAGVVYESVQRLSDDMLVPVSYRDPRKPSELIFYYNVTLSVDDPSVFDFPFNCTADPSSAAVIGCDLTLTVVAMVTSVVTMVTSTWRL